MKFFKENNNIINDDVHNIKVNNKTMAKNGNKQIKKYSGNKKNSK